MDPVNLTNLHSMTDGDVEMEQSLFEEFYTSFEEGIDVLRSSAAENINERWRTKAHALKGIALNLGAEKLGALCKSAQENHSAASNIKNTMLAEIIKEYTQVKEFLSKLNA